MQRPATEREPWIDLAVVSGPVAAGVGHAVDAGLIARTALAERGEAWLLDTAWRVAPDVTVERHTVPSSEHPDAPAALLARQGSGLLRVATLDPATAGLLGVCDGSLTARVALGVIAELLGESAADTVAAALPTLRAPSAPS